MRALHVIVPTLTVDAHRCKRNIKEMSDRAARNNVVLRPHFKTHQSIRIGNWMRDCGIGHITVSSLRMARYFAIAGWSDITVAFPVNLREKELIEQLTNWSGLRLHLLVESVDAAKALDNIARNGNPVWIKIDVGSGRTGIPSTERDKVFELQRAIKASTRLEIQGFLAHAGHTYAARGTSEVESIFHQTRKDLTELRDSIDRSLRISCGDTPSCTLVEDWSGIDEMRPGNYVFYDLMQAYADVVPLDRIAVAMACPVVAVHPRRNVAIVYGGGIHFSKDSVTTPAGTTVYGIGVDANEATWESRENGMYLKSLSQEHGIVHVPDNRIGDVVPGDLLWFLPVHSCMTAQCMGVYSVLPDGSQADHFGQNAMNGSG